MTTIQDPHAEQKTAEVLSKLGQRLLLLSRDDKNELLGDATQAIHNDENKARAASILARLGEFDSGVAAEFCLKRDGLDDIRLRMICSTPEPDPGSAQVDHVASYIAVSYCWHSREWELADDKIPLAPGWGISKPMMEVILALRQSPNEGIWLDQLCINQDDAADKRAHIGIMDAIYRSARRVAILMEDVQLNKDEEEAGVAYAASYEDLSRQVRECDLEGAEKSQFIDEYFPRREQELRDAGNHQVLAAVEPFAIKMLSARWYTRAWCAHESRMAKHQKVNNPLMMCFGSDISRTVSFEFRFLHYLALYLSDREPPEDPSSARSRDRLDDAVPKSMRQLGWRIMKLFPDQERNRSAMQHLLYITQFGCFQKGDLMSIALNTVGIPLYFQHDES